MAINPNIYLQYLQNAPRNPRSQAVAGFINNYQQGRENARAVELLKMKQEQEQRAAEQEAFLNNIRTQQMKMQQDEVNRQIAKENAVAKATSDLANIMSAAGGVQGPTMTGAALQPTTKDLVSAYLGQNQTPEGMGLLSKTGLLEEALKPQETQKTPFEQIKILGNNFLVPDETSPDGYKLVIPEGKEEEYDKMTQLFIKDYKQKNNGQEPPPGAIREAMLENKRARPEDNYGKGVNRMVAEGDMRLYDSAIMAKANVENIDHLINQLETSEAITGAFAEFRKDMERVKSLVGSRKAAGLVVDTEYLDALMGQEVFPLIKQLGIGARGMDTPAEREFLRSVMTGSISLNKDTLLKMAKRRRKVALDDIKRYNSAVDSGDLDRFFQESGRSNRKIDIASGDYGAVKDQSQGGWSIKKKD